MLDLASNAIGSGLLGGGDFSTINAKSYGLISGFFFVPIVWKRVAWTFCKVFFVLGVKKISFKVILYFIEESQMGLEQMNK